jgi:hypothetical protein
MRSKNSNRKRSYWLRRFQSEEKQNMKHESISTTPTQSDMVLVARRVVNANGKAHPAGSILEPGWFAPKNLQAALDARSIAWQTPASVKPVAAPKELPEPPKATPNPVLPIVDDPDIVQSWHYTKDAAIRLCNGDSGRAADLLFRQTDTRDLYRRAVSVATKREAARRKVVSVSPDQVGL